MLNNHFIILITAYNCEKYIEECLISATNQDYKNYEVVIVDDHSTDRTWELICQFDGKKVRNAKRVGDSLPNTVMAINMYSKSPEDIIVHLDGDDKLIDETVLSYLNEVYQDDVWITYGQYEPMSHRYHNYCTPIPDMRTYRRSGVWRTSHLKTWKRWLWNKIEVEDLCEDNGEWFSAATDNAFMYPMLEMAGMKHHRFIDKVLYLYNDLNQANYMKERPQDLIRTSALIQSMPLYDEL